MGLGQILVLAVLITVFAVGIAGLVVFLVQGVSRATAEGDGSAPDGA